MLFACVETTAFGGLVVDGFKPFGGRMVTAGEAESKHKVARTKPRPKARVSWAGMIRCDEMMNRWH